MGNPIYKHYEYALCWIWICMQSNKLYAYIGLSENGYINELVMIDLKDSEQKITVLSKSIDVPTSRYRHAMSVYDDKLYILGGACKKGNE